MFKTILANPCLYLFAAEADQVMLATTYFNIIPNMTRSALPYAIIENVVIRTSVRATGVGKHLMQHTLRYAWSHGCYKTMLLGQLSHLVGRVLKTLTVVGHQVGRWLGS